MYAPITVIRERCLNSKYKKMNCQLCRKSCPCQCIGASLDVDAAVCNQCGICLAVCPSEAIAGENYRRQPYERLLVDGKSPVVLACRRQDDESIWPCLGFLDGRLLLTLVLGAKDGNRCVVVDDQACMGCRPVVAEYIHSLVNAVNKLLVLAGKSPVLQGENAKVRKCPPAVSRRAFFTQLLEATVKTVREVATAGPGEVEFLPRQELFIKYADKIIFPQQEECPLFYNISIDDACRACGLCAKVCPEKAIVIRDYGMKLDISYTPLKCTGCGLCSVHCPEAALTLTGATILGEYHVAEPELPRCLTCGQIYQPAGNQTNCLECMLKSNRQIIS